MTINPHPFVLMTAAEQRHAEVLALTERERRAQQAWRSSGPRPGWIAFVNPRSAGLLALLLAVMRQG